MKIKLMLSFIWSLLLFISCQKDEELYQVDSAVKKEVITKLLDSKGFKHFKFRESNGNEKMMKLSLEEFEVFLDSLSVMSQLHRKLYTTTEEVKLKSSKVIKKIHGQEWFYPLDWLNVIVTVEQCDNFWYWEFWNLKALNAYFTGFMHNQLNNLDYFLISRTNNNISIFISYMASWGITVEGIPLALSEYYEGRLEVDINNENIHIYVSRI